MPKQYKTIFIALFASLFLLVVGSILWVSLKLERTNTEEISDNVLAFFHKQLDLEASNALFLSVALSDNKAIKEALLNEDEDLGYLELTQTLEKLKTYTYIKDIRTQIITADLDIFARSWENSSFAGMPLEGFRADLQRIRRLRKPKVSIDPGRLLTIKATTPIRDGVKTIGYIEAIKTFDEITTRLREHGVELLVLMEERFLDIATLMRENPTLGNFVVSNRNYDGHLLPLLTREVRQIARKNYFFSDDYLHVVDGMRDSAGERIGYYLLTLPKAKMGRFQKREEQISFFLQLSKEALYDVASSKARDAGSYRSLYDREMVRLLGDLPRSEREMFEEEAREILQTYTKEELIDVILQREHLKKVEGEIR